MAWSDVAAIGAVAALLGTIFGNTKLAASIVNDIWHYIKRRPTRTKRLEVAFGGMSDTLCEVKDSMDALQRDHQYNRRGMEVLMKAQLVLLDKTPGNGEVSEVKREVYEFVSCQH